MALNLIRMQLLYIVFEFLDYFAASLLLFQCRILSTPKETPLPFADCLDALKFLIDLGVILPVYLLCRSTIFRRMELCFEGP